MILTDQTKADLTSILETLDQRIHEVTKLGTFGEAVGGHERVALGLLREATLGVFTAT